VCYRFFTEGLVKALDGSLSYEMEVEGGGSEIAIGGDEHAGNEHPAPRLAQCTMLSTVYVCTVLTDAVMACALRGVQARAGRR
jgi:hypothetical protein